MAITKIKPIKGTLNKALDYIQNPAKTDEKMLVSSFGCSYEAADIEFGFTLSQALDKGSNLAHHLIQSFEPGEVDYQTAHEIGRQLADAVTKGQHEYVLTTHIDKGHIHNHVIFCAVNFVDHHKYNSNKRSYYGMETLEPFNIIYQTAEDGLGDTVKPRLMEAEADLERVLVIDDRDTPLTLADERIARAIRENNARLVIIDPVQAFLGADVDMNRANEVRPIFRSLGDIAQATGCAIVLIGHLNKAAGTQSTYRGLGSIDITAAVRSLLFIGKLKDSPTTRVLIHEKSSLAPPGQSLAFSLGDEKGFEWIGAYDITADELLAGTDTAKTESKTAQAEMLILELLADGKKMPSAELEKTVNERGISSRTMRTAKSRIGDRLVTEKEGTAWVCYLRD